MAPSKLGHCFNCFKEHNEDDPPAPAPDFKKLPLGGGLHQAALEIHDVLQAIPRFVHDKEERKQVVVNDIKTEQLGVDDGHFSLHVANGKQQLWQNWGQSQDKIELEPLPKGLTRYPTRLKDVQTLVRTLHAQHYAPGTASQTPKPHLRVVGHGHSWTPIFADQRGDWVIFCRGFEFEDGTRIKNAGLAPDGAPLVKITAGVRTGELVEWFEQEENYRAYGWDRSVGLSSDVILDNVRYGGVVANGCHGTGWNSQTVSDMVYSISIVNHEGDLVVYDRNSDPALFNAARCHFGLLGVTYNLTLKLDNDKAHPLVQVDHMKPPQGTYFGPDSGDKLKRLVEDSYAVEIFWFPLTSYVTSVHNYDPMKDRNWMKVFTKRLAPSVGDREPDVKDDVLSTIRDWLRVNIGGAVNWWAYACSKPFLMSLFSGFAMAQLDDSKGNVLPLGRAIHYQKSIDDFQVNDLEFCFKVDADFENVKRAWVEVTSLVKKWVDEKGENPLSVTMECRFTAHSDIPLSPAYGKPGDHFCWMEVLSLAGQQNWEAFTDEVARKWIDLGLNPKPHWAKWNVPKDASKPDICLNLAKEASAKEIAAFSQVVALQDPRGMFQTTWLKNLFGLTSH